MTEEEMRQALFGSVHLTGPSTIPKAQSHAVSKKPVPPDGRSKTTRNFVPKLIVTLRVGNEYEGKTELITHEADTLSHLQAEMDALKIARKQYRYIELVSVRSAQ
ncbi:MULTISPECIES: hypothetical protein [Pseudomonas syringae group genomosp. 2]|uniref:hypothetical protein n=1 Tax=Pseudomonas syringae group genomosp. 2 TaxID=251698 RepID=UPI0001CC2A0E|nr:MULTISPECIES: hypothetical protein [Pseudomonas syringae group genomosp. 2]EGH05198.1 hypothetical protein PSYAE_25215 [Pseudomonas amygdali pv. aesculi str. 0893_23]KPW18421.1 Uncharacterized protein ALO90_03328 [Pseudomonas amygdali pv. aesculi]KWT14254.1 hypothetical protein AL041_12820 [Pseudomonas amygdali pv. aesculi]KWT26484.1 hypothetical protein AL044_19990 [Pseudomonas amygdali pv. aesculi]KWT26728.1 hypothetical protein AL043_16915 [Pseudomonas amygdali pv. aesculi]